MFDIADLDAFVQASKDDAARSLNLSALCMTICVSPDPG
jgi:hypothetical protein